GRVGPGQPAGGAARGDPVDLDGLGRRLVDDRAKHTGPLYARDLDPEMSAVGEPQRAAGRYRLRRDPPPREHVRPSQVAHRTSRTNGRDAVVTRPGPSPGGPLRARVHQPAVPALPPPP